MKEVSKEDKDILRESSVLKMLYLGMTPLFHQ